MSPFLFPPLADAIAELELYDDTDEAEAAQLLLRALDLNASDDQHG